LLYKEKSYVLAGIDNVSHFIALFKRREELTPLAFRRKWQRPKEGNEV
jgi:hypothetical protein